jgi:hypothetical protein
MMSLNARVLRRRGFMLLGLMLIAIQLAACGGGGGTGIAMAPGGDMAAGGTGAGPGTGTGAEAGTGTSISSGGASSDNTGSDNTGSDNTGSGGTSSGSTSGGSTSGSSTSGSSTSASTGSGGNGSTSSGGIGPSPPAGTTLAVSQLQGRWLASSAPTPLSLVLGPARGDGNALEGWILAADLSSLTRVHARIDGDGLLAFEGSRWPIGRPGAIETVRESAAVSLDRTLFEMRDSGMRWVRASLGEGGVGSAAAGGGSGDNGSALPPPDPVGIWSGSFDAGRIRVELGAGADGMLAGRSTSGCLLRGGWSSRAGAPWVDVQLSLDCGAAIRAFAGIGTLSAADVPARAWSLALVETAAGEPTALVLMLAR